MPQVVIVKHLNSKIETPRLLPQKHELELAPSMFSAINKERLRLEKFLPWVPNLQSTHDERQYILSTHERWKDGSLFDYSLILKDKNQFVGCLGVHTIDWESRSCELGYWILNQFEGQGYVTEALRALEKHLFEKGFNRLEIRCDPINKRSARIPTACGFLFDGTLHQETLMHQLLRDTSIYSKLKQNYGADTITPMTCADYETVTTIMSDSLKSFPLLDPSALMKDLHCQQGLILRHQERIQGFVLYFSYQGIAEISYIAIAPQLKNQGFGHQLIKELKQKLKSLGYKGLQVDLGQSSAEHQLFEKPRRFFEQNNFQKIQPLPHDNNRKKAQEGLLYCPLN